MRHPMSFFQGAANLIRKRRVEPMALSDALKLQLKNRQRCPQFVGRIRGKAVDVLESLIQPLDHAVQRNRKPFEFIPGSDDGQAFAEVSGGNSLRPFRDLVYGLQRSSHQPITAYHSQRNDEGHVDGKRYQQSVENDFDLLIRNSAFDYEFTSIRCRE